MGESERNEVSVLMFWTLLLLIMKVNTNINKMCKKFKNGVRRTGRKEN